MPIKVLLCLNGEKDANKFTIDRNSIILKKALKLKSIEYTYDYKGQYDLVHVFSLNQLKTYYSYVKKKNRKPVILSLFNDFNDIKIELKERLYTNICIPKLLKEIKDVSRILVKWPLQKAILEKFGCNIPIDVISFGVQDYTKQTYLDIEKKAFRRYYRIPENRPIIFSYGEYDYDKGLDTLEAVSRMLPNYEFFFFGGASGPISNSKHYDKKNNNINLHYESNIHRELYHSLLMTASCLFIPNKYHFDSVIIMEGMKQGVPIVSNESYFLSDLLIKDKTCFIENNIEDYFKKLKDIAANNLAPQAREYIKDHTIEQYSDDINKIYLDVLNK